ncbi:galactose oxidase [Micractinium conductrix]|uniref:Galactose oxidase n=1 Tax=Micractinium conductrix TaxID=554055 RepID=A0A2P6V2R6_9CHLO|nr:galactose oxidase [Micractinium conductrix]|eukprot:PSC68385.1 galactose oxidase [Micractinium conductrix]
MGGGRGDSDGLRRGLLTDEDSEEAAVDAATAADAEAGGWPPTADSPALDLPAGSSPSASEPLLVAAEDPGFSVTPPPDGYHPSLLSREGSLTSLRALPPPRSRWRLPFPAKSAAWFAGTIVALLGAVVLVALAFPLPPSGSTPACRTGAVLAVLPPAGANGTQQLVVWGGRGQSGDLFHGLHLLSMTDLTWRKVKERGVEPAPLSAPPPSEQQQPPATPLPSMRWRAGAAQIQGLGLLIHGGEATTKKGRLAAQNDTWLLRVPELRWQRGAACADANCSAGEPPAPAPRLGHSLTSFQDERGRPALLLFGGRRQDGVLLNDVWLGTLEGWPVVTWTLLHDPQAGVGTGPAPLPRRGHAAVMQNGSSLIIHGGRSEVYGSFTDVWSFSLAGHRWSPLLPTRAVQPAPRDSHAAVLWQGRLLIYGGRFGSPGEAYRPIGDRWVFDLQERSWVQLPIRGLSPLPRFLFGWAQFSPVGGGADQLAIFGGETGSGCKLNDAWVLDLGSRHWVQLSSPAFATRQCDQLFG